MPVPKVQHPTWTGSQAEGTLQLLTWFRAWAMLGSAPSLSSRRTAATLPLKASCMSGLRPSCDCGRKCTACRKQHGKRKDGLAPDEGVKSTPQPYVESVFPLLPPCQPHSRGGHSTPVRQRKPRPQSFSLLLICDSSTPPHLESAGAHRGGIMSPPESPTTLPRANLSSARARSETDFGVSVDSSPDPTAAVSAAPCRFVQPQKCCFRPSISRVR